MLLEVGAAGAICKRCLCLLQVWEQRSQGFSDAGESAYLHSLMFLLLHSPVNPG